MQSNIENILCIGDTHIPAEKEGYLEFCYEQKKKYKCKKIIHIGDLVDNAANSYFETNPDGLSPKYELKETKKHLREWYKVFPKVDVIMGNHDRLIQRKLFTAGIAQEWIKSYSEVLGVPNWNFHVSYEYGNLLFVHGEGGIATTKALNRRKSVIQGHLHSKAYIDFNVSDVDRIFACQVGSGIDDKKANFIYGKDFAKKSIISCVVILENGTQPILIPMKL